MAIIINKLTTDQYNNIIDSEAEQDNQLYVTKDPLRHDLSNLNAAGRRKFEVKEDIAKLAGVGSETLPVYFDDEGYAFPIVSYEGTSNNALMAKDYTLDGTIAATFELKQDVLTQEKNAGTGITIVDGVISCTGGVWGFITGTLENQIDLKNALDKKQDKLTAGKGITIVNNVISCDVTGLEINWSMITGNPYDNEELARVLSLKQDVLKFNGNIKLDSAGNIVCTYENLTVDYNQITGDVYDSPSLARELNKKQDKLSDEDLERIATVDTLVTRVDGINDVIPEDTTDLNTLVNEAMMNDSIQLLSGNFRGSWDRHSTRLLTEETIIPTNYNEYPEDPNGNRKPLKNDYLVVLADELHSDECWRYKYVGNWDTDGKNGWKAEYRVNEKAFSQSQMDAINSGITASKIADTDYKIAQINSSMSGYGTRITEAEENITDLTTSKQNKLIAGDNITLLDLADGTTKISSTGGLSTVSFAEITGEPTDNTKLSAKFTTINGQITTLASDKQDKTTAVTHTQGTAAGGPYQPVYINASGVATPISLKFAVVSSLPSSPDSSTIYFITG